LTALLTILVVVEGAGEDEGEDEGDTFAIGKMVAHVWQCYGNAKT